MTLPPDLIAAIEALRAEYRDPRGAALPALELAAARFGHVTPELCEALGPLLGTPGVKLWETATFYTMLRKAPEGKHRLSVCRSVACDLLAARDLLSHLERTLGVRPGETTPDGLITLHTAECLGACGAAPVVAVDDVEYHERMTSEKVDRLVADLRARG